MAAVSPRLPLLMRAKLPAAVTAMAMTLSACVSPVAGPQGRYAAPMGDAPVTEKYLAMTVDCNGGYVYLDPYEGAKAAVAEACRNLACSGALPLGATDNLNMPSPLKPELFWQIKESVRGLAEGCKAFNAPVTGGNCSLTFIRSARSVMLCSEIRFSTMPTRSRREPARSASATSVSLTPATRAIAA